MKVWHISMSYPNIFAWYETMVKKEKEKKKKKTTTHTCQNSKFLGKVLQLLPPKYKN
jgi:hypothetical protein